MKIFATAIIISILANSLLIAEFNLIAEANPPPGVPIIKIYSPADQTYNSNLLVLNISVYSFAGDFGNKWIGYSLDNEANTTISTNKDATDTQSGLVYLPSLTNGIHTITVYAVYNFSGQYSNSDMTPYTPSSSKTVSFAVDPNSTPTPSSTNPPATLTPTATPTISPTQAVPDFPNLAVILLAIIPMSYIIITRKYHRVCSKYAPLK
jgi:hypothetical protein